MRSLAVLPLAFAGLALAAEAPLPTPGGPPATGVGVTITGTVKDVDTGSPLAGVQVFVQGTGIGTLSGAGGGYSLPLPDRFTGLQIELRATLIGYATSARTVDVAAGAGPVNFGLSRQAVGLEAIIVEGEAAPPLRRDQAAKQSSDLSRNATFSAPASPQALRLRGDGWRWAPPKDREAYAYIEENEFRSPGAHPLSTFGIDVDRASYANVRRFLLGESRLPPADAVRIEELVNYFPYAYAAPRKEVPFAVHTHVAPAPWAPAHRLLRIAMRGREFDEESRPPSNLVFLIDVSGSMQSPDKLPLLKQAFRMLVGQLGSADRVSIVVYAGAAGLVLPPTPGHRKDEILHAIDNLQAGGSTAGGAGIRLAYQVARKRHIDGGNNRVILATDGDFNVGASSDSEMVRLIEERRRQGTFLTVLGFGTGNLQDAKMEQIADHGNGNFAYIDSALEAKKVLVSEVGGTLHTIAKDVKIQVEFNPAVVRAYRLIGYENRMLAAEDFDDDDKDAGELGAGHTVTALYEVVPVGAKSDVEAREPGPLRYGATEEDGDLTPMSTELAFVKLRYKAPDGERSRLIEHPVANRTYRAREDLRFAASVAAFGMLLRDSEHAGAATWDLVLDLARGATGDDEEGYRAEFVRMIEAARELKPIEVPLARRE
ncbi:MAG: von Willebrand factor type A domain-containing protein [Gemmatimonadota bacterium]